MSVSVWCRQRVDRLHLHHWQPGDALDDAVFDTKQPPASADTIAPDLLLVPLLGFTASGHRIGYGKGYYDRLMQGLRESGTAPLAPLRVTRGCLDFDGHANTIVSRSFEL